MLYSDHVMSGAVLSSSFPSVHLREYIEEGTYAPISDVCKSFLTLGWQADTRAPFTSHGYPDISIPISKYEILK